MTDPLDIEKTLKPASAEKPAGSSAYTLSPGQTLGQYKIIRPLGRGGMGEVYEAEHQVLRRRYALKLLPAEFARQSGALERFQREAQVMANLEHPHIIKVDEFGETGGRYWLRMELAEGQEAGMVVSLQDLADSGAGRIDQTKLANILKQILDALAYAHERGAIHRDLKPSNILFSGSNAKISDFGLVRLVGEDWVRSQAQLSVQRSMSMGDMRTMQGQNNASAQGSSTRSMLGTFEYMSPEQKRGEEATAQSDLYSVGLMAFKLLTGQNPGIKPPTKIDKTLAPGWDEIIEASLEEAPRDRWPSAAEMREALDSITSELEQSANNLQADQDTAERERRRLAAEHAAQKALAQQIAEQRRLDASARKIRTEREAVKPFEVRTTRVLNQKGPLEGQNWTSPSTDMEFVWIEALKIWVGKFEVTNGEYRHMHPNHDSGELSGHSLNGDRQPVVQVNFKDGKAFAKWLTHQDRSALGGALYRLPSEQEWINYAQCGDGREYPWGNEWPPPNGRSGNYSNLISGYKSDFFVSAPVDQLWRNPWGLHGVGGNVWEACASHSTGGSFGAWRGASWFNDIQRYLRCSSRFGFVGTFRDSFSGFRLVLSPNKLL